VATLSLQVSVNNALSAFIQPGYLAGPNVAGSLIPKTDVGVAGGIAPLNASGVIPSQYVPSLGVGYCLGAWGPTQLYNVTNATATPTKLCDWGNIGQPGISFQPVSFMVVFATGIAGARPVVEVRISSGSATYANQTLIARGVGRNCWNDLQTIPVLPFPASSGHTGVAGSGYPATYNFWATAWIYDLNSQGVSVQQSNIANAAIYLVRYQL
jgi:hypothetical protein